MTSRTTSPSLTSTRKSSSEPPAASPRHTRKLCTTPMSDARLRLELGHLCLGEVLLELALVEEVEQVTPDRGDRLGRQRHLVAHGRADEIELAPLRIHRREVLARVPAPG